MSGSRGKNEPVHDTYAEVDPQPKVDFELMPNICPMFPNQFHLGHAEYDRCYECGGDRVILLGKKAHERMCLDCQKAAALPISANELVDKWTDGLIWSNLCEYMKDYKEFKSILEESENGIYEIIKWSPNQEEVNGLKQPDVQLTGGRGEILQETYTILHREGVGVCADSPDQITDLYFLHQFSMGTVLICGLKLGTSLQMIIEDEDVEEITILEEDQELIDLVIPAFKKKYPKLMEKVTVIQGSAQSMDPLEIGGPWDIVWIDTWLKLDYLNLNDMTDLEEKFRPVCNDWLGFHGREYLRDFVLPNYNKNRGFPVKWSNDLLIPGG